MSGAGMMDCKKALMENNGDVQKAQVVACQGHGLADKQGRIAAEGVVIDYIHAGSKLVSWLKSTAKPTLLLVATSSRILPRTLRCKLPRARKLNTSLPPTAIRP